MRTHVEVEEQAGVGKVDLVDVIVDRAAVAAGQLRNGEAIVREAGTPTAPVESRQVAQHVDLVGARGIADPLDRVDEDALGPPLAVLGAEKDPYRWLRARGVPGTNRQR